MTYANTSKGTNNVLNIFTRLVNAQPAGNIPSAALKTALDIVANAHESGLLLVPTTPNDDMVEAAHLATQLPQDEIKKVWHAMLQAW